MDKIEHIDTMVGYAFVRTNYRKKDRVSYQLELNNARYEGAMRSDFSPPKIDEYTYDRTYIVKLSSTTTNDH